jgi:hypothetical protein
MTTTPVGRAARPEGARLGAGLQRELHRDDIWERMVRPGDRLPSATLLEADLGPIHLDRLRQTGPIVLVFFRYATSEPCAATLAGAAAARRPEASP